MNNKLNNPTSTDNYILQTNSLMIAVILCANFISIVFASLGIISDGLLPIIIVSALAFSYVITLFNSPKNIIINKNALLFVLFIITFFVFSLGFRGFDNTVYEYFIEFIGYGFIVFLLTLLPFKPYEVIRYTMLLGIIYIINPIGILNYIEISTSAYDRIQMGPSYAILPTVVAAIIHFVFYRDRKSWINILGYFTNLALLIVLLTQASRGTTLAILFLLTLIIFIKFLKRRNPDHNLVFFILTVAVIGNIVVAINIKLIILWLYQFLQGIGIEVATLIKTYSLIANEDLVGLLNGRNDIYIKSFELFMQSPLWGHGIGIYADIYGGYPHNLFLQVLSEGGLLLFIPIAAVVFGCVILFIRSWSLNELLNEWRLLLLLLFVVSIPRLMFSSYLWQQQSFWLTVFIYFLITSIYKRDKSNLSEKSGGI